MIRSLGFVVFMAFILSARLTHPEGALPLLCKVSVSAKSSAALGERGADLPLLDILPATQPLRWRPWFHQIHTVHEHFATLRGMIRAFTAPILAHAATEASISGRFSTRMATVSFLIPCSIKKMGDLVYPCIELGIGKEAVFINNSRPVRVFQAASSTHSPKPTGLVGSVNLLSLTPLIVPEVPSGNPVISFATLEKVIISEWDIVLLGVSFSVLLSVLSLLCLPL